VSGAYLAASTTTDSVGVALVHDSACTPGFAMISTRSTTDAHAAVLSTVSVSYGRVGEVAAIRQAALDAAYGARPERFPNGPPRVRLPPAAVHINPMFTDPVEVMIVQPDILSSLAIAS
jgi:hypothetical protein